MIKTNPVVAGSKTDSIDRKTSQMARIVENVCVYTVHRSNISNSEKMSHLKTLLDGKTKLAISRVWYSGEVYTQAGARLERTFSTHI